MSSSPGLTASPGYHRPRWKDHGVTVQRDRGTGKGRGFPGHPGGSQEQIRT